MQREVPPGPPGPPEAAKRVATDDEDDTAAPAKRTRKSQVETYEAVEIMNHRDVRRGRGKQRQYLVRWAGDFDPSWEPPENIPTEMVETYFEDKSD